VITPGPSFKVGGRRPAFLQSLAQRLRGSRLALAAVFLISFCATILGIMLPAFSRLLIDRFLVAGERALLGVATALLNIVGLRYLARRRIDATQRL